MPKATTPRTASKTKAPTKTRSAKTTSMKRYSKEELHQMIQTAAYHIAEKDGFKHGREHDYWVQAERQIQELFPQEERQADMH